MAQQATSGQVTPSLTEASVGIVARDVLAESNDCHMDQSDGSDNHSSAKCPEVLMCAAADSTTAEEGPGLWIEDRQPTEVEGIEEHEEEEGGQEEGERRHKEGKVRRRLPLILQKRMRVLPDIVRDVHHLSSWECADSAVLLTEEAQSVRSDVL